MPFSSPSSLDAPESSSRGGSPPAPQLTTASAGALVATDIQRSFADRVVLDGVSLVAPPGRRVGLVGDNGSGKSTLLRILAGTDPADGGDVVRPPDTALLEQELAHAPETTIGEVVEEALAELRDAARHVGELSELVQRLPHDTELAREYGDALEWAQLREAWDADHRTDRVMRGLGLDRFPRSREIGSLSGGERARVALAALLVRQPRALLLDEPTNHLDDEGLEFLERHLRRLPGVVVLASHDRAFLDATCTDLLDLDPAREGATRFGGTFSGYLAAKARDRRRWEHAYANQQAELRSLEASLSGSARAVAHGRGPRDNDKFIHHFKGARVQRSIAGRLRAVRSRIAVLERSPVPKPPEPLRFSGSLGAGGVDVAGPLVQLDGAGVDGRLAPVSLEIGPRARLLVLGRNGAGKSTLLDVLTGELPVATGSVEWVPGVRVALLPQDVGFDDPAATPREVYDAARAARRTSEPAPDLLDLGLLRARDVDRPLAQLSQGQARRVALAQLIVAQPDVLLLDEPTNHLSPTLVSELEDALLQAECAVVIATHDRWLRQRWTGSEMRLGD